MYRFVSVALLGLPLLLSSCARTLPYPQPMAFSLSPMTALGHTASGHQALIQKLRDLAPSRSESFFRLPESDNLQAIPQDPKNPLTPAKVKLGQWLYHETALGQRSAYPQGNNTYSCATCHHAAGGFQANRRQGLSDGALGFGKRGEGRFPHPELQPKQIDFQPIRTPAALNTAWQKNMLWNGQFGANGVNSGTQIRWNQAAQQGLFPGIQSNHLGFDGVETQAIAGQEAHRLGLKQLKAMPTYQAAYAAAFPEVEPKKRINPIQTGLAIAAYERTLLANRAPFQRWLRGELEALKPQELRGALLFFGKAQCATCHTGPALNSMRFESLGLGDMLGSDVLGSDPTLPQHLGRGGFTKNPAEHYKFKVPQLYNLADSPFLGHGGTITSVAGFIDYLNQGVAENPRVPVSQLAPGFKPLGLNPAERQDLTAFVRDALRDPQLARYQPKQVPSGNCLPNNDAQSRQDLGC